MVRSLQDVDERTRGALLLAVAALHLVIAVGLTLLRPEVRFPPTFQLPPMDLILASPASAAPPEGATSRDEGGAPAAPARIHRPPVSPPEQIELPAPEVLAPVPEIVVGVAPVLDAPGWGRGGAGDGAGTGIGRGDGTGQGRGAGPQLIHGPAGAVMTANVDPSELARLPGPYAVLHCYVHSGDPRLRNCRVTRESPAQSGVGEAARAKAAEFRYRPPTRVGRTPRRERQIVAIAFPPDTTFPVDR